MWNNVEIAIYIFFLLDFTYLYKKSIYRLKIEEFFMYFCIFVIGGYDCKILFFMLEMKDNTILIFIIFLLYLYFKKNNFFSIFLSTI